MSKPSLFIHQHFGLRLAHPGECRSAVRPTLELRRRWAIDAYRYRGSVYRTPSTNVSNNAKRRLGNVTAKGKQQRRASSGAAETKRALQKSNLISTLTISLQSQLLDTADCGKGLTREHERFEMRTPQAFVAQPPYRTI